MLVLGKPSEPRRGAAPQGTGTLAGHLVRVDSQEHLHFVSRYDGMSLGCSGSESQSRIGVAGADVSRVVTKALICILYLGNIFRTPSVVVTTYSS